MSPIFLGDSEDAATCRCGPPSSPSPELSGTETALTSDSDGPELLNPGPQGPEPIAIIGMGCRLPGGASTPSKLWELLEAGRSAQGRLPADRYNMDAFYHPNGDRPGSMNTSGGYFIQEDVRGFDNSMFGINHLEAMYMDPQQRKLLEVTFEAFEAAGLSLDAVSGANVGCYVGNFVTDFITMQLKDAEYTHRYTATGSGTTILANRISHVFNLKGPSFVIDTACSSSLYCLHAACSALWQRECDAAVVAGANLIQSPEQQLATMKAGVLSGTSTCHTFDASADGYGRADGIGVLLVKRLSDAIRDNDPIRSVIRSTAVNSNGKTNGITLPSADGQEAVIRKAYALAGLGYGDTDYVECHGTGTAVGDPIEVEALSRVFRRQPGSQPLLIGSVKTNLGHSEAASGISSLLKVAMALECGRIPPTIGISSLNPKLKLDEWNMRIVTENTEWPQNRTPNGQQGGRVLRRAGVNSFGYGGANAHCILESPDTHVPRGYRERGAATRLTNSAGAPRTALLLPVSSKSVSSLEQKAADIASYVAAKTASSADLQASDLAYTLGVRRSHLSSRGFWIAAPDSLSEDVVVGSDAASSKLHTRIPGRAYGRHPLAFVFTGQGAQWAGMGRELMDEFPSFRRTVQMLDSTLQLLPHPPTWTLRGALLEPPESSSINLASRSQPVCTAVQLALVRLLRDWGVAPGFAVGHSSGEIAAAYAAGRLTARQAIAVAYYRGYAVERSTTVGAMMAAGLSQDEADGDIAALGLAGKIRVACVNSPESVTISGDTDGIDEYKAVLDGRGVFARLLKTDGRAYHSHHMAAIGGLYEDLVVEALASPAVQNDLDDAGQQNLSPAQWISSVTGQVVGDDMPTAEPSYWRANLESPVLFAQVVEKLLSPGTPVHLVEIGPHSALEMPIKQTRTKVGIDAAKTPYNSALLRGKNSTTTMLTLAGELFLHGHPIAFGAVNNTTTAHTPSRYPPTKPGMLLSARQPQVLTDLPRHVWDYDGGAGFHEPRSSIEWRNRTHARHDLLGSRVPGGDGITRQWRNVLRAADLAWLVGHKLDTTTVLPAAGYLAMAVEAACQSAGLSLERYGRGSPRCSFALRHVHVEKALMVLDDQQSGIEVFTTLQPATAPRTATAGSGGWYKFIVSSFVAEESTRHAHGLVKLAQNDDRPPARRLPVEDEAMEQSAPRTWYRKFVQEGLNFSGPLQSLSRIETHRRRGEMHLLAQTSLSPGLGGESAYALHPIAIDALFQSGPIACTRGVVRDFTAKVPVYIEDMELRMPSRSLLSGSFVSPSGDESAEATAQQGSIRTICKSAGLGAISVDSQLFDGDDLVLRVSGCRMVPYSSGAAVGAAAGDGYERHPMLHVAWKPDVERLADAGIEHGASALTAYLSQFQGTTVIGDDADGVAGVLGAAKLAGGVLDLVVHKRPTLHVLLASDSRQDESAVKHMRELLGVGTAFQRCLSLWKRSTDQDGAVQFQDLSAKEDTTANGTATAASSAPPAIFDVLVILDLGTFSKGSTSADLASYSSLVDEKKGTLIRSGLPSSASTASSGSIPAKLSPLGFSCIEAQQSHGTPVLKVVLAQRGLPDKKQELEQQEVLIVERNPDHKLNKELALHVAELTDKPAKRVTLDQLTPELATAHATVIATVELEDALLADVKDDDFAQIKTLTDHCTNLIWVTGGGLADGTRPEQAVVFGLSRALMMEQPSLRFFVVGVDGESAAAETTARQVLGVARQALLDDAEPDFEFVQDGRAGGALQVSRFVPDDAMNSTFRQRQPNATETLEMRLGDAQPCRLSLAGPVAANMSDAFVFTRDLAHKNNDHGIGQDEVEVQVLTVGLHARDLRAMTGEMSDGEGDTQPHAVTSQYVGSVVRVGSAVESLAVDDSVLVMAPGRCATVERIPASSCRVLRDGEDPAAMASLPLPACTALYALRDRARLQPGETVLVCYREADAHGRDRSGPAAVHIARALGANVFAVVVVDDGDDEAKQEQRSEIVGDLGLPETHVSFVKVGDGAASGSDMLSSHGRVQVVANFCTDRWPLSNVAALCADDARIVNVGRGTVLGELVTTDPTILRKNIALSTFDVNLLLTPVPSSPSTTRSGLLLDDVLSLWRQRKLNGLLGTQPRLFDVANLAEAFRALGGSTTQASHTTPRGAVSVSFEDTSLVRVAPPSYHTVFNPDKSYLLVGCLGGLGRSMSRWMLSRGARKFTFLGRSGTDREPAARLVQDLELCGASVTVVRGDVVDASDVERAVAASAAAGPIGGVVQAAMGLDEALFTAMPAAYWRKGLAPKVRGSLNLHAALAGRDADLDFFLMTSSVSGSVGTATESNYCAANYFLDVFARHRRGLGLPATSVGLGMISEVGYLHENPEIEAMLLRKGIQAISEDEMLNMIDISLSASASSRTRGSPAAAWRGTDHALAHTLTGLEPIGVRELRAQGFDVSSPVLGDPRASLLAAALAADENESAGAGAGGASTSSGGLPAGLAQAVAGGSSGAVAAQALEVVADKFSNLVLVPRDRLDLLRPLSDVGVDSMLAAEFRGWIYQQLKVNVPYLTMLASTTTLTMLSELIAGKLLEA
ncbi:Type I Iterative PKS [Pyricularia oryzae]|nr:Type I Iterative PKS [Pyricularia oryzae]